MRRAMAILLVFFGLATIISGVFNFFPPFKDSFSPGHAFGACAFGLLLIAHVRMNRKPTAKYLGGLGWWWLLVGLGFAGLAVLVIVSLLRVL